MEEDQNGVAAAVVGRPPNSETCGMIVNHGGGGDGPTATAAAAAAAPPTPALPAAAATAFGAPARPAPRYGAHLNCNNNNSVIKGQLKGPGTLDHRNRRTRRGKRKSRKQTPYMKDGRLYRDKAVAPNNTNQFLMDDHNDGPDIDKKLLARYSNENGRTRNSSYTSVESEGDQYSSSSDDGTSIQKEFIDTYRLVQEEELAVLTKNELVQRVIELEEKIQMQESNKRFKKNTVTYLNGTPKEEDEDNSIDIEEYRALQVQNRELITQNKLLQAEIDALKQIKSKIRNNDSDSSIDSESSSDSSSSSSSSDGQEIEMKFLLRSTAGTDD
ncbi:protein HEXIM [Acyrthosiphon pisum]|uniref:Protein HEXIM1 n=1 Tax=Acyrthosiphon pisum TaxID=7029 RepID=A0A8R2JUS0_ACYPI|nr:protein HEXIM [Acyrthosiphon pisum]XP_029346786.1 protein HEXIM [Acyrthosiphon pisum]|eukprot:XP_001948945.1 PREDICTED: protein HEXIM [Acyrthosiphon pisum]